MLSSVLQLLPQTKYQYNIYFLPDYQNNGKEKQERR